MTELLSLRWLAPVALVFVLGYQASELGQTLQKKTTAQQSVNESVLRWKQGVQAVSAAVQRWTESYPAEHDIQDVVGLLARLNLEAAGLTADTDKVFVNRIDPIKHQGVDLGLTQVCLASGEGGGDSLLVQAPDYGALLRGMRTLAERQDIHMGSVSIAGERAAGERSPPTAKLGELCLLVRK